MEIFVNGSAKQVQVDKLTLAQLLQLMGLNGVGQAVAVGNRVVPRKEWETFDLTEGMKLTVIKAVCGG